MLKLIKKLEKQKASRKIRRIKEVLRIIILKQILKSKIPEIIKVYQNQIITNSNKLVRKEIPNIVIIIAPVLFLDNSK